MYLWSQSHSRLMLKETSLTLAGKGQQILLQKSCKGKQQAWINNYLVTERTGTLLLLLLFVKKYKQHAPQNPQIVSYFCLCTD